MSPKPFGKPLERHFGKASISKPAIAVLVFAPLAFAFCLVPAKAYPPLDTKSLFWGAATVFAVWAAIEAFRALRARTMPAPPDRLGSWKTKLGHAMAALLLSAPIGLCLAFAYEPALQTVNGAFAFGSERVQHAMVEKSKERAVLRSPYWKSHFEFRLDRPEDEAHPVGSLARLQVSTGALGVPFVSRIDFEELR